MTVCALHDQLTTLTMQAHISVCALHGQLTALTMQAHMTVRARHDQLAALTMQAHTTVCALHNQLTGLTMQAHMTVCALHDQLTPLTTQAHVCSRWTTTQCNGRLASMPPCTVKRCTVKCFETKLEDNVVSQMQALPICSILFCLVCHVRNRNPSIHEMCSTLARARYASRKVMQVQTPGNA